MAEITDPVVTTFLNASIRPMNEQLRERLRDLNDVLTKYEADVAGVLTAANDADTIEDGRETEGVAIRTVGELRNWLKVMEVLSRVSKYEDANDNTATQAALNEMFNQVNVPESLVKFTVRLDLFQ